ncbi:beta-galactosidase [Serinibacter arcticus]|uniref:Beta-galactosidase n=1 Tax=Serinibacter arcticus TaxID=1655435 RepID=A0A2U1ZXW3_9MICO|nr:glycoside hydrolase family 2 TIM barrel-domain containing protein [Serinibacter arcticus]PWD51773.1 beta-galactosidase [Serinibacter arcticus]
MSRRPARRRAHAPQAPHESQAQLPPHGPGPGRGRRVSAALVAAALGAVALSGATTTFQSAAAAPQEASPQEIAPQEATPAAAPAAAAADDGPAPTFEADYLDGVSGSVPTTSVSLAGTWDFEVVTETECASIYPYPIGPQRCTTTESDLETTIQVPGGGWHKQGFTSVSQAIYSREITVPDIGSPQVTTIALGAVNHQATLSVDGEVVATNMTAFTDSVFDISAFVTPGSTHTVAIDVKGRNALVDEGGYYTVPEAASWSKNVPQGIFRSATLEVVPALNIADTFVTTSVADGTVTIDAWLHNGGDAVATGELTGVIGSASDSDFDYPAVPAQAVSVPAGETVKVTVGPLAWKEGSDSYWWPNVPYVEGYRAELHELDLSLEGEAATSSSHVRFGFREIEQVGDGYELNGAPVNFRGDSPQGANYDSIDFHGRGDAFHTYPGFLEPSADNAGWPQVVDNYQRLNYNSIRIHQEPASPYMLDVADEMGLMIMSETAIRGSNGRQNLTTGFDNMVSHVGDLVRRDRNHASVLRWSQANEPTTGFQSPFPAPGYTLEFDRALYWAVMAEDTTRPISSDGNSEDLGYDNYTTWCHYVGEDSDKYTDDVCEGFPAPGKPHGSGEHIWYKDNTHQGFMWFATSTERMRTKGAADIRPYSLLSAWGSFVPGVSTTDVILEQVPGATGDSHPLYGEDNLADPWSQTQIARIQKAFSPLLVSDDGYWEANKKSNAAGEWPARPVTLAPGTEVTRTFNVFNDTLDSTEVTVDWSVHRGAADGPTVAEGVLELEIGIGEDVQEDITFTTPAGQEDLVLVVASSTPEHGEVFVDDGTRFVVGFADVAADNLFFEEIAWARQAGITTGWTEPDGSTTFRPLEKINRDAMAAFLYRLADPEGFVAPAVSPFTDVPTSNQFYTEIAWLEQEGITTGWTEADGTRTFRPLEQINRDAVAAFLYRLADSPAHEAPAVSPFTDVTPQTQYYAEITWLAETGVARGWEGNDGTFQFEPLLPIARDAMAAFLYRFDQL